MKIKTGLWIKLPQLLRLRMLAAAIEQQKERKKITQLCLKGSDEKEKTKITY
jgi:hypothetical protein